MGYVAHDVVIVHTWRDEAADMVDNFRAEMPEELRHLVVGPIPVVVNDGDSYFLFAPDGSKEGWDTSDEADDWREKFIDLFKVHDDGSPLYDVVAVRFGGDYGYEVGAAITYVQPDPS